MLKILIIFSFFFSSSALAGGGMTGGATLPLQIIQNANLVSQLEQDILSVQQAMQQTQMEIQNLADNPLGNITPDLQRLATQQARLGGAGAAIANSMSAADQGLSKMLGNSTAGQAAMNFSDRFKALSSTTQQALRGALLNAGLQRENFTNDVQATQALVSKVQASNGNLAAVKTLGEVNAAQLMESVKIRDMLTSQGEAQSIYMAAQVDKADAVKAANDSIMKFERIPMPSN